MNKITKEYKSYKLIMAIDISGIHNLDGFNECTIIDPKGIVKAKYYAKGNETAMIKIFRRIAKLCAENNNNVTPDQVRETLIENTDSPENFVIDESGDKYIADTYCKYGVGNIIYDKELDFVALSDIFIIIAIDDEDKSVTLLNYNDETYIECTSVSSFDIINKVYRCIGYADVDKYVEAREYIRTTNNRNISELKSIKEIINSGEEIPDFDPEKFIRDSNMTDIDKSTMLRYINSLKR